MKLHIVVLSVLLAACGKANDVPALGAEAQGLVKNYAAKLEDLNTRANAIMQRGNAIGVTTPQAQTVSRMFSAAKGKLDELRNAVSAAPPEIDNATRAKDKLAMQKLLDGYTEKFGNGFIEINGDFDAVESWLAFAEAARSAGQIQLPPPSAPVQ